MIQTLDLYLDLARRRLVSGPNDSSPVSLAFTQGDTYNLVLHGLLPVADGSSLSVYETASIQWSTLSAGLTLLDAPPLGGTWKVTADPLGTPQTTAVLQFNASKDSLSAALNALSNVVSAGGLTVLGTGASNFYWIQWTTPANALTLAVTSNKLTPLSFSRYTEDAAVPGSRLIKLMQAPIAFTSDFSLPTPPAVTITEVRAGTVARNEVQRITLHDGALGGFAVTENTQQRSILQVATVTASAIADNLNAPYIAVSAADIRFSVTAGSVSGTFDVEFIGAYANPDGGRPLMTVTMFDQVSIDLPTGTMALTGLQVEGFLNGAASNSTIYFEIVAADSSGRETTLVHQLATIVNDGLDAATAQTIAEIATAIETVYVTVDPGADAAVIAMMGVRMDAPGYSSPTGSPATLVFTHDLNTLTPLIEIWTLTNLSPETWTEIGDTEYEYVATSAGANATSIVFPYQMSLPGVVGAIKVTFINPDARPYLYAHRYTTDDIDASPYGVDAGSTLTEELDALFAMLPTDWPSLPANKITGLISASQLDLSGLGAALAGVATFLDTLRALITDPTIVSNLAKSLATSTDFLATLEKLMSNSDVIKALMTGDTGSGPVAGAGLANNADFISAVKAATLVGDTLPPGTVPMLVPDLDLTFPGSKTDTRPPPLLCAQYVAAVTGVAASTLAGNTLAANLALLASDTIIQVTGAGYTIPAVQGRRAWPVAQNGFIAAFNGVIYEVTKSGTATQATYFPTEYEQDLFSVLVTAEMFPRSRKFHADLIPQLSLNGNVRGEYILEVSFGTLAEDAGTGYSSNLASFTWATPVLSVRCPLMKTMIAAPLSIDVTNPATSGAITAAVTFDGTVNSVTAPGSAPFAVRARLRNFDIENRANPRGNVNVKLKDATASIAAL